MNKKKQQDVPVAPEQTAANVRSYFTKEINDRIQAMSMKEMEAILKDMPTTTYWIALLKYSGVRSPMLDSTLRTTDPIKDPSKISWAQGALAGLCDLETYIIDLNEPKFEGVSEDNTADNHPEGIIG